MERGETVVRWRDGDCVGRSKAGRDCTDISKREGRILESGE
jgi:hypothetical protein